MTGISIHEGKRKILICGVDGAGKKSFANIFFSEKPCKVSKIKLHTNIKKLLFVIILDGLHLENVAEAEVLEEVLNIKKKQSKDVEVSCLVILNKTDLFYNRRKTQKLIREIYEYYQKKLQKYEFKEIYFVAFSYLATKIFHSLTNRIMDKDDCDDACFFLHKIGRHIDENIKPLQMQQYLLSHKNVFSVFSGEKLIQNFLTNWRKES